MDKDFERASSTQGCEDVSWLLSLVVPVMNEEDSIDPFIEAVLNVLEGHIPELEILFVDDGSKDATLQKLREASTRDGRIRYLSFTRNFGKEIAMTAGLEHARGEAVVPIDVDLQHPPETILEFVRLWREQGYDMVYGLRHEDNEETAAKRQTSGLFYRVFNRLSHTEIPPSAGDFRLLDRCIVDALKQLPERNRFMKGLYSWVGFRSIGIPYQQPSRQTGASKFNYWKLWNFALDGLVSFSTWPLRMWSYIGGGIALLSFIYILVIVVKALLFGRDTPGYASVMSAVLFFGGMQLLSVGILGEYVARLFMETKQRPLYLVAEISPQDNVSTSEPHEPVNRDVVGSSMNR
ncbi:glycosyltransferase family 2 protein [Halomonas sp. M20]|uniref:glycosyltransferase family 2 protein n=1 Tax=Halomonas sp. M20 TaxID=2763264 RepID=UPI001D0AD453|nr:glycosyltransferase family 2 protein [Halomonas sp. M20]